jgi:hypothetical protein
VAHGAQTARVEDDPRPGRCGWEDRDADFGAQANRDVEEPPCRANQVSVHPPQSQIRFGARAVIVLINFG